MTFRTFSPNRTTTIPAATSPFPSSSATPRRISGPSWIRATSFSKIGVQLTDSIYVVLNMRIMTIAGASVLKKLGTSGEFTKCLHSKADLDINRRLILHFPEDNTIWSVGSG
ncbi:MAG: hypothetical protein HY879_01625, partial [Deltaproteobacteria bacterium]|nr:hypothetical protein [Deltaproteobacteria bacterium]